MKHLKTFCRWYLLPAFLLVVCKSLLAQTERQIEVLREKEGIKHVKSAQIRKEMANFSSFATDADKKKKVDLIELSAWKTEKESTIYGDGEFGIIIDIVNFTKARHVLKFGQYKSTSGYQNFLYAIDRYPFWGTDGNIPTQNYKNIIIVFGNRGKHISLPKIALKGLYQPSFSRAISKNVYETRYLVFRTKNRNRYYVFSMNSDGAGAYEVTWIFENGKYLRRVVDNGY